jgi:superfamily II DNA helicase RecQ
MVIKATVLHSGWSYGNGDDQYDNVSLGSTKTAVNLEKSVENSKKNKKNEYDEKMCRRQEDKHTKDQGWTTIDTNRNCKPKSKTNSKTIIDSIISSIDVELNIDTNGTLEANIDSPVRENRCTIPDKNVYDNV